MPMLRDAANRWYYANADGIGQASMRAWNERDFRPLREMFARCFEAGAGMAFREVARDTPAIQRFTEMLILLGEWEYACGAQEMGTGRGTVADTPKHTENGL